MSMYRRGNYSFVEFLLNPENLDARVFFLKLEETNVFVTSEIYSCNGDFYFTGNLNIAD